MHFLCRTYIKDHRNIKIELKYFLDYVKSNRWHNIRKSQPKKIWNCLCRNVKCLSQISHSSVQIFFTIYDFSAFKEYLNRENYKYFVERIKLKLINVYVNAIAKYLLLKRFNYKIRFLYPKWKFYAMFNVVFLKRWTVGIMDNSLIYYVVDVLWWNERWANLLDLIKLCHLKCKFIPRTVILLIRIHSDNGNLHRLKKNYIFVNSLWTARI